MTNVTCLFLLFSKLTVVIYRQTFQSQQNTEETKLKFKKNRQFQRPYLLFFTIALFTIAVISGKSKLQRRVKRLPVF